jgi:hypothetical protein
VARGWREEGLETGDRRLEAGGKKEIMKGRAVKKESFR